MRSASITQRNHKSPCSAQTCCFASSTLVARAVGWPYRRKSSVPPVATTRSLTRTRREHFRSTSWTSLRDGGGGVPAYLLYNHEAPLPSHTPHWHCCKAYDPEQLGCTLVPTWCIRQAIRFRGGRTFPAIHAHPPTRPWRCVFDCHKPMEQADDLALSRPEPRVRHDKVMFHRQRPDWILTDDEPFDSLFEIREPLSTEDLNRLLTRPVEPPDEYLGHQGLTYPRRVLAVDVADSTKEPESE